MLSQRVTQKTTTTTTTKTILTLTNIKRNTHKKGRVQNRLER